MSGMTEKIVVVGAGTSCGMIVANVLSGETLWVVCWSMALALFVVTAVLSAFSRDRNDEAGS